MKTLLITIGLALSYTSLGKRKRKGPDTGGTGWKKDTRYRNQPWGNFISNQYRPATAAPEADAGWKNLFDAPKRKWLGQIGPGKAHAGRSPTLS